MCKGDGRLDPRKKKQRRILGTKEVRQSTLIPRKFVLCSTGTPRSRCVVTNANRKILSLSEACIYFLPEYSHIGRGFWIMSRRRLLDHNLRLLEYCTFFVTSLAFSSLDKKNLVISVPYKKERWKPTKLCLRNECVCGSHSGILDNIEIKESVKEKISTPTGLVWYINFAFVSWVGVTVFCFSKKRRTCV